MGFSAEGPLLWPIPPDWTDGVFESLEWLTEVQRARSGRQLKRQLRLHPRRTLEFSVIADQQARRVLDAILNDRGGRYWVLPLWYEVQWLDELASGANFIPCHTEGFEFAVGSRVALYLSLTEWWLAEIVAVESDGLVLDQALDRDWPVGVRVYPVRSAHLVEQPEERGWTDAAGRRSVQFLLDEHVPWTVVAPAYLYIALDVSGSMEGERLSVLKQAMNTVLDSLERWQFGAGLSLTIKLTAFSTTSTSVTGGFSDLRAFVDGLSAGGSTDALAAYEPAVGFFDITPRTNVLVCVSDGEMTNVSAAQGIMWDMLDKTSGYFNEAEGTAVSMYGVGIGTSGSLNSFNNSGSPVPVVSGENAHELADLILSALLPFVFYRGALVLEQTPDWSNDISSTLARDLEEVDASTGPVTRFDWPGRAFRHTEMPLIVGNRSDYAALRSLLYALRGRMQTFFVPTLNSDLVLAAAVGSADTQISIEWAGYQLFGRQQVSGRDIRLELWDGTLLYRRITDSADNGSSELLTLDNALGQAITPDQVRRISWMPVSELASDSLELEHVTDAEGVTRLSLSIKGAADVL